MSDVVLAWLSVWIEVKVICIAYGADDATAILSSVASLKPRLV